MARIESDETIDVRENEEVKDWKWIAVTAGSGTVLLVLILSVQLGALARGGVGWLALVDSAVGLFIGAVLLLAGLVGWARHSTTVEDLESPSPGSAGKHFAGLEFVWGTLFLVLGVVVLYGGVSQGKLGTLDWMSWVFIVATILFGVWWTLDGLWRLKSLRSTE